jgi:hypothetical protein
MALPKITTPTYTLKQPSTGEEIEYRPFLVGEEKILLMAMETDDEKQIYTAVMKLVNSCTNGLIGSIKDPTFDIEYSFLKIRGKSVAETIELSILCPDDNESHVSVALNTDDIEILVDENHTNEITLNDEFKVIMRYPTVKDTLSVVDIKSDTESAFSIIKNCIDTIIVNDEIYNRVDISNKELNDFFDSMTQKMLEDMQEFFSSMPKLRQEIEVTNPNTNVTSSVVLEGLSDFFG